MSFYKSTSQGISISVYIQPRSAKNQIVGIYGDALKIKIISPPVEGQANQQIQGFLAKVFNVAKSSALLQQGKQSRTKVFLIKKINEAVFKEKLQKFGVNI